MLMTDSWAIIQKVLVHCDKHYPGEDPWPRAVSILSIYCTFLLGQVISFGLEPTTLERVLRMFTPAVPLDSPNKGGNRGLD